MLIDIEHEGRARKEEEERVPLLSYPSLVVSRQNSLFFFLSNAYPSSETQGQLDGSIKCPWRKFTVRDELVSILQ